MSLVASISIGLFGPDMLNTITVKQDLISTNKQSKFSLKTPYLGKFHQKLWVTAKAVINGRKEEFSKPFILNIHLHDNKYDNDKSNHLNKNIHSQFSNKTRYLHCRNEDCDVFSILHLDYLHAEQYDIELTIFNLDIDVKSFIFTVRKLFNQTLFNPFFLSFRLLN
jgi:hypothetical protein